MKKRILLIGDSIRMAYAPLVQAQLENEAEIVSPEENCEDSQKIRKKIKKWLKSFDGSSISLIHWNCGLHDIKRKFKSEKRQVSIQQYVKNLKDIIAIIQTETKARIIWATTTPVIYEWHHKNKGFDRFPADVEEYNRIALQIMNEAGIPINDLYDIIQTHNPCECLQEDGVHMKDTANNLLTPAIVKILRHHLE